MHSHGPLYRGHWLEHPSATAFCLKCHYQLANWEAKPNFLSEEIELSGQEIPSPLVKQLYYITKPRLLK